MAYPRHLAAYDDIVPGSAERIIAMAEKAQNHNITMQQQSLGAEIADQKRGMYLGAAILLILVVAAFSAGAIYDNNVLAGLLLGAAVLNVVALFIRGRSNA
ncbi:DUF2335 domain-containing protein [uncultured Devosia sp.]|uniref:DUF2335 domain-containing protein n=1 Tax=uncultured Devosia sp. TaxID=211434 RepID=UPI0035CC4CC5